MGRSFASVLQHAKDIAGRWARSSHSVPKARQPAHTGKIHSGEAFFGFDDPLELEIFPVLLEIRKLQGGEAPGVDP